MSARIDLLAVILAEVTPAASGDDRSIATIFDAAATLLAQIPANTAGKVTHENGALRSDYHTSREQLTPYEPAVVDLVAALRRSIEAAKARREQDELDRAKSTEATR